MKKTDNSFFATEENLEALRHLLYQLPKSATSSDHSTKTSTLRLLVTSILSNAAAFDAACSFNIKWIGNDLVIAARTFQMNDQESQDEIDHVFALAYRFLCELEFGLNADLGFELQQVKAFVDMNMGDFSDSAKRQLTYAHYLMPARLAKEALLSEEIQNFRAFNDRSKNALNLKIQWDQEIADKESKVNALKDQLGKLESGFNFVGLVAGFRELATKKRGEKFWVFLTLIGIGTCTLLPIACELLLIWSIRESIEKFREALILSILPIITIEILLIYFFRVLLIQFRSVKAQLLQLELRIALCQFIESYSEFSAGIKQKDPTSLAKFESLIFSGLLVKDEQLPSTFDGTEQIANLIKSIKS